MSISNPVIGKVAKHFGYVMVDLLKTAEGILNAETELEDEAKVNAEKKSFQAVLVEVVVLLEKSLRSQV